MKQVSIGHILLQAVRPRSLIAPIPFGLRVYLDHVFGSKWAVDLLARLGLTISSGEVRRFRQSYLADQGPSDSAYVPGAFVQWIADNVDHNTAKIDGKGTFHGMGIISAATPSHEATRLQAVKRLKERPYADAVVEGKGVPIFSFVGPLKPGRINMHLHVDLGSSEWNSDVWRHR